MSVKLKNAVNNIALMNALRTDLGLSYQSRIPVATRENIQQIGNMITSDEFEIERNQWQRALFNKIGMTIFNQYVIDNPLSKYIYGSMSFGDAIEEVGMGLFKGRPMDYGKEGQSLDPFVKASPEIKAEYHRIDEPIQYMYSLETRRIRRAFTEENGIVRLMGLMAQGLYNSANVDTWLLTKNVMSSYIHDVKSTSGIPLTADQKATVAEPTDEASSKAFLLAVKNAVSSMYFPHGNMNPQKIPKSLKTSDLVLFVRADVMNTIGVEALSAAFNVEHLNLNIDIEQMDNFGDDTDDVIAILAERWWLLITQQYEEQSSIFNPRGSYWNTFLTRAMSFGASYFKDAIIFKTSWD